MSYVTWGAEIDTPDDQVDLMQEVVGQQICADGLKALKTFIED